MFDKTFFEQNYLNNDFLKKQGTTTLRHQVRRKVPMWIGKYSINEIFWIYTQLQVSREGTTATASEAYSTHLILFVYVCGCLSLDDLFPERILVSHHARVADQSSVNTHATSFTQDMMEQWPGVVEESPNATEDQNKRRHAAIDFVDTMMTTTRP